MQNVRVAVRCRPLSSKEIARDCTEIVKITNNNIVISNAGETSTEGGHNYTFDHCYYTDSTQVQVYKDLGEPMLLKALDGFNGTLFAYGQTGSGKSYSMMGSYIDGDELNKGIIPRLNIDLWTKCQDKLGLFNDNNNNTKILVSISFLEIYNENIKDLLNPNDKIQLKIRESPEQGIYVEGLCELIVKDAVSINRLIDQGNTVRRVAATNMNEQSSRSHSVFTIKVEQKTNTELEGGVTREQIVKAKLNLVDLAGSERANKTGATGSTLKEGANINMSLMALGNVINALSESAASKGQKRHIPYRDSKLTRLLQESLGGNSATVMLAAISPADYNYDETLSTLKYAHRAKSIENVVVRNEDMQERMIRDLKNEIENLRKQLHEGGGIADHEAERKLRELQEAQKSAWEERERLSKQLEEERQSNMNTVISNMMTTVKDQKVNIMKNIKRLSNEKANITKKMKSYKDSNDALRGTLDELMVEYQTQQGEYDNLIGQKDDENAALLESIGNKMASLLVNIEASKNEWVKRREDLRALKSTLDSVEEEITSERGELVATAGLLDQNDKLRAQIVEEERLKAKELIEREVTKARELLDMERSALQGDLASKHSEEILKLTETIKILEVKIDGLQSGNEDMMAKNKSLQQYIDDIEGRITDAEVSLETLTAENNTLTEEVQRYKNNEQCQESMIKSLNKEMERMMIEHKEQIQIEREHRENDKIKLFEMLMAKFNEDSNLLISKYKENQRLLALATGDIVQVVEENKSLKSSLEQALAYERRIYK